MVNITDILHRQSPLTKSEEIRLVFSLAWPSIIEQIMITMMQYIDTAMVGSLGANATAAIGLVTTTIWLFNGLLAAAGIGFSVQVAQLLGAKKPDKAREVVRQAILFNIFFGILLAIIAFALSFVLPNILGANADIAADAGKYFAIVGLSLPFLLAENLLAGIIRCTGDTKTPMLLNILICILDVIFNIMLIYPTRTVNVGNLSFTMYGAGLGVAGAALGTALAILVVAILLYLVLFVKKSEVQIKLTDNYSFTKPCIARVCNIGVPVALERGALAIAQIIITVLIAKLGNISIAANHLAVTAEALSYLPAYGIAAAATTLVGQAIGAHRDDLAVRFAKSSTIMGIIFMSFTGVLLFLFAPWLISIFTQDPEVIRLGAIVLRIEAFAQPLFAASIVIVGALRGAGDSKVPFFIALFSMWGVRIVLSILLAPHLGLIGVWAAMCAELCVRGIIFVLRLRGGKWLRSHRI